MIITDVFTRALDGLQSTLTAMGNSERDKAASTYFAGERISDEQLITAYQSNWMTRNVVGIPAMDALRKGWRHDDKHDEITLEEKRLNVAGNLMKAYTKGRLFGGAALYMGTADKDLSEPMEPEKLGKGGLKYLNVITRLQLVAGNLDNNPESEYFGQPESYQIHSDVRGTLTIHPSRLVIFNGDERADPQFEQAQSNWPGISVLDAIMTSITNAESIFCNTSSLVHEANIDVLAIPNLMANIGNAGYESQVLKRAALFARSKGIHAMGIMDSEEELIRHSADFSNLPQLIQASALMVSAAGKIPATRFLAQAPSGLQSTGESDMNNYYDLVQVLQHLELDPAMPTLRQALISSSLNTKEPIGQNWEPLRQMSEIELAELGKTTVESIKAIYDMGSISSEEARLLTIKRLSDNGSFPNIAEHIDEELGSLDPNDDGPGDKGGDDENDDDEDPEEFEGT